MIDQCRTDLIHTVVHSAYVFNHVESHHKPTVWWSHHVQRCSSTTLDQFTFWPLVTMKLVTLKITLIFFPTLKKHGNHTEKYLQRKEHWIITQKYFPFLFKDTEITLKKKITLRNFQSNLFLMFPGFSALVPYSRFSGDFQYHIYSFIVCGSTK